MEAKETVLQALLEGTKQYIIPLFQREYNWGSIQWKMLLENVFELYDDNNIKREHFMGSIVTMPIAKPESITKFVVIDGQQRLVTFFILLSVIKNKIQSTDVLYREIKSLFLVNEFQTGSQYYKMLPTENDKDIFFSMIEGKSDKVLNNNSLMAEAYKFFDKGINESTINLRKLKDVVINNIILVSIKLDSNDDPYRIFESLNATGLPLAQSDLIRNYFFMRLLESEQKEVYKSLWKPMQEIFVTYDKEGEIGKTFSNFIRHFLMKEGRIVKEDDVYTTLKEIADNKKDSDIVPYIKEIFKYAKYYSYLLNPKTEENLKIRYQIDRINRLDVTTSYPFFLNIFNEYYDGKLETEELIDIFLVVENFVVRRSVCGVPSNQLNKLFPKLYSILDFNDICGSLKEKLRENNYPTTARFKATFPVYQLYKKRNSDKAKLILESLESSYKHKEQVDFEGITVEHIMPQTLSDVWKKYLGKEWEDIYSTYLHTIGNLTLTGYNSELSNAIFEVKRKEFLNGNSSHIELNKYFSNISEWNELGIKKRADLLTERAVKIWPSLWGENEPKENIKSIINAEVTGTKPVSLTILNQVFKVNSWRDVLIKTLENIYLLDGENFDLLEVNYPNRINKDSSTFRDAYKLNNGYYIELNLNAVAIRNFCYQILSEMELSEEDWKVEIIQRT